MRPLTDPVTLRAILLPCKITPPGLPTLVQRHHQLTRDRDGRVVQAPSFFELRPPPKSDTQIAGERIPSGLSLTFLVWKRSLGGVAELFARASNGLKKGRAALLGGDDEFGRWNRDRMLALLTGDERKTA